tara:strand:- start:1896 stop:3158 length:1263 start_codon:yes stop_codon:yes gene_type:complete
MSEEFPQQYGQLKNGVVQWTWEEMSILSEGFSTTYLDLCDLAGPMESNNLEFNIAYTDRQTLICLGNLIEGPIQGVSDLEGAENALQLILWHDQFEILSPSIKYTYYVAPDTKPTAKSWYRAGVSQRPEKPVFGIPASVMELLEKLRTQDKFLTQECFVAPEEVVIVEDKIVSSSDPASALRGTSWKTVDDYLTPSDAKHWLTIGALALEQSTPAYFSDPRVEQVTSTRGFIESFYDAVKVPWTKGLNQIPSLSVAIDIPPLVAIVMNMAKNRQGIPDAILELRSQLKKARSEMREFNLSLMKTSSQTELQARCRHLQEAFEATTIVARKTNAERRRHTFMRGFYAAEAIVGSPMSSVMKLFGSDFGASNPFVRVDRTITTKQFSKLLDTETTYGLLEQFLTETERRALQTSKRVANDQG